MKTKAFPPEVKKKLKWYVYLYLQNRRPFYVGKGKGDRAFTHLGSSGTSKKAKRIRAIEEKGNQPQIEILRYGLTEGQALLVEAAVIDSFGLDQLTNEVRGQHSRSFGRVKVDDVTDQWTAPKAEIAEPCILITINKLYRSGMRARELMEVTRGIWKVGLRRNSADFAMAVFEGVIREVYKIKKPWCRAGTLEYKTRDKNDVKSSSRWEFKGQVAPDQLRKKYIGKSVRGILKRSQNPIRYVNCK